MDSNHNKISKFVLILLNLLDVTISRWFRENSTKIYWGGRKMEQGYK